MKRAWILASLLLLPTAATAQQRVTAEPWFSRTIMFSAELGGAAFSDFQRALARPDPGSDLENRGLGDFQRRVSASTAATTGASLTWWIGSGWGVRLAGSYSPSRFRVWNEQRAQETLEEFAGPQPTYAKLHTWTVTGAATFRFPFTLGRVVPYGLAGGGIIVYEVGDDEELPPEARSRFAGGNWSGPTATFGVGAAIPLERWDLLLNFELTNHMSRTPLDDEGLGDSFDIGGVPLHLAADPERGSDGIAMTNQLRLTLGITLPLRVPGR